MSDASPDETPVKQEPAAAASELARTMRELTHTPGWKTTEFYIVLLVVVVLNTLSEKGIGNPNVSAIVSALLALFYQFLRQLMKTENLSAVYEALMVDGTASPLVDRKTINPQPSTVREK